MFTTKDLADEIPCNFLGQLEVCDTLYRPLKLNQPISAADLEALEGILFAADGPGDRSQFEESYGTDQPLGQLVREIIGLDPKAAKEAFAEFLTLGTLSADQITFIDQIIDHLVHILRDDRPERLVRNNS